MENQIEIKELPESVRITAMAQSIEYYAVRETFLKVVEILNNDENEGTKNIRAVRIYKDFVGADILFRDYISKLKLSKLIEIEQVGWIGIKDGYLALSISGSHGHKEAWSR